MKPPLVIAYRSRSGHARRCAEEAGRSAEELGHPVRVVPLPRGRHLPDGREAVLLIGRTADECDDLPPLLTRVLARAAQDLRRVQCRLVMLGDAVPAHAPLLRLFAA
jgi:hypothetical protein